MIEPLELRIAPATLVNPTTVTYQDVDGDTVTVKLSKPLFSAGNVGSALTFDTGSVDGDNSAAQQLRLFDAAQLGPLLDGTGITITARRSAALGGDGFVNVGAITSLSADLGAVVVRGDLGRISAGDFNAADLGLKSLNVQSFGRLGTSTQGVGGSLASTISGTLGSLVVASDIVEARVETIGGSPDPTLAGIGSVRIGGSIIGGDAPLSGRIFSSGAIGPVTIGGDITGGAGEDGGAIFATTTLDRVSLGGSLHGGDGDRSGSITSLGAMRRLVGITGDITGGGGDYSGRVFSQDTLFGVMVGGGVLGGGGLESGGLRSHRNAGNLAIRGDVFAGDGTDSGSLIMSSYYPAPPPLLGDLANTGSITIGGSFIGGLVLVYGSVTAANINGSIIDANLSPSRIGPIKVGGSVIDSMVFANQSPSVKIGGTLANSKLGSATGAIRIGGDVVEGDIQSRGVASITIGGSVYAGTTRTVIRTDEEAIGSLSIGGSVIGTAANPVFIEAKPSAFLEKILAFGSIRIGGSVHFTEILAGAGIASGNPDAQIGPVTVGGDWIASTIAAGVNPEAGEPPGPGKFFGNADDAKAGGVDDPAIASRIASITIKGQVLGTVGGADHYGFVAGHIGAVTIGNFATGGTTVIPLTAGPANDNLAATDPRFRLGATSDVRIREI